MKSGIRNLRRLAPMLIVAAALSAFSLAGCDAFSGSSTDGSAHLNVGLVDSPFPFDLVESVSVTISGVEVVGEDSSSFTIADDDTTFDLLDLRNGVSALVGDAVIPAGTYTQVRLTVEDASVLLKDGRSFDLKVPSGRIKVLLDGLTVEDGQDVTLTLDFDVDRSFVVNGNANTPAGIKGFLFKPTVVQSRIEHHGDDEHEVEKEEHSRGNNGHQEDDEHEEEHENEENEG